MAYCGPRDNLAPMPMKQMYSVDSSSGEEGVNRKVRASMYSGTLAEDFKKFEVFIGFVLLINTITLGVEQSFPLTNKYGTPLAVTEVCFICIYTVEVSFRFYNRSWRCLADKWIQLDICIVIPGLAALILSLSSSFSAEVIATLSLTRFIRPIRLLAPYPGLCKHFSKLWSLAQCFCHSIDILVHTGLFIFLMLYIFALVGVEMIKMRNSAGDPDDEVHTIIEEYFSTLPVAMLSLVQFLTMDSIGSIYRPLIKSDNLLAVYFVVLILVVPVVMLDLVTASVVSAGMEQQAADLETKRKQDIVRKKHLLKQLHHMFDRIDADKSGMIDREEMFNLGPKDEHLLGQFMGNASPFAIFDALDIDGGGQLDVGEFCEGLYKASVDNVPIELRRIDKVTGVAREEAHQISDKLDELCRILKELTNQVSTGQEQLVSQLSELSRLPVTEILSRSRQHANEEKPQTGEWTRLDHIAVDLERLGSNSTKNGKPSFGRIQKPNSMTNNGGPSREDTSLIPSTPSGAFTSKPLLPACLDLPDPPPAILFDEDRETHLAPPPPSTDSPHRTQQTW